MRREIEERERSERKEMILTCPDTITVADLREMRKKLEPYKLDSGVLLLHQNGEADIFDEKDGVLVRRNTDAPKKKDL